VNKKSMLKLLNYKMNHGKKVLLQAR
jgi:hypothetical protein